MSTTDALTSVTIRVWARCPACGKTIERSHVLDGESLTTGNTTQTAKYAANYLLAEVNQQKQKRQWRDDQCAACGDP